MAKPERGKAKWWLLFAPWLVEDTPDDSGEVKGFCPYHEDHNPSCWFNMQKEVAHCKSGCGGINFYTLEKRLQGNEEGIFRPDKVNRERQKETLSKKAAQHNQSVKLEQSLIEHWHDQLLQYIDGFLYLVGERGLFDTTVYDHLIGWDSQSKRYTIPIYDENGDLVNVRRYKPHAPPDKKMFNLRGHGSPARLFPVANVLENDEVLVVEGEWDALVASQYGFPAVSGTGGSTVWRDEWTQLFRDKTVTIIYDNDEAGDKGALVVASKLHDVAAKVRIAKVPLDKSGADISDLFNTVGWTSAGLQDLIDTARPYAPSSPRLVEESDYVPVLNVTDSYQSKYVGKTIKIKSMVIGRHEPAMYAPEEIEYECTPNPQDKKCQICPMFTKYNGHSVMKVERNNLSVLEYLAAGSVAGQRAVLERLRGIPPRCTRWNYNETEVVEAERLIIQDMISSGAVNPNSSPRDVYNVGEFNTREGSNICLTGTTLPHPKDKTAILYSWKADQEMGDIDSFELDESLLPLLRRFQPSHERPIGRVETIAEDLASNVTRIYGRTDLHVAVLLAFFSPLEFRFKGESLRGRIDAMILGDTRTGKTRAVKRLIDHIGAGILVSGESLTQAGLLAAVTRNSQGDWSIRWGIIPQNDRRIVVIDEASGLVHGDRDLFSELSSLRDSGIAQVTKAQSGAMQARTRMLWLSNPVNGKKMTTYPYGCLSLYDLVRSPEDVARFDYVLGLADGEVGMDVINTGVETEQAYTSQAFHSLLMWVWSRHPDQIRFTSEAEDTAVGSWKLGQKYTSDMPLIQPQNVREKVARVAAAIAALTFSTDDTMEMIIVRKDHVEDAIDFLDEIYSKPSFGYRDYSASKRTDARKAAGSTEELAEKFRRFPGLSDYLRRNRTFTPKMLGSSIGFFEGELLPLTSFLEQSGYIRQREDGFNQYEVTQELYNAMRKVGK